MEQVNLSKDKSFKIWLNNQKEKFLSWIKVKKNIVKLIISLIFIGFISFLFALLGTMIYDVTYYQSGFSTNSGMYPLINEKIVDKEGKEILGNTKTYFEEGDKISFITYDPNIKLKNAAAQIKNATLPTPTPNPITPTMPDSPTLPEKTLNLNRFDIVYTSKKDILRVIGFPGETVKYDNNDLYINGKLIEETFLSEEMKAQTGSCTKLLSSTQYFLAYDNRGISLKDSRTGNLTNTSDIKGKVIKVSGTGTLKNGNLISRFYTFGRNI